MKTESNNDMMMGTMKMHPSMEEHERRLQERLQQSEQGMHQFMNEIPMSQQQHGGEPMFGMVKKQVTKYKQKVKNIASLGFKHSPSIQHAMPQQSLNMQQQQPIQYKFLQFNQNDEQEEENDMEYGEQGHKRKKRIKMTEAERKEKNRLYAKLHRAEKKKQQKMLQQNNKALQQENKCLRQMLIQLGYTIPMQNQILFQAQQNGGNVQPDDMQMNFQGPPPHQGPPMQQNQDHPQHQHSQHHHQQMHPSQMNNNPHMNGHPMNQQHMMNMNQNMHQMGHQMGEMDLDMMQEEDPSEMNLGISLEDTNFDGTSGINDLMMDPNMLDPLSFQLNNEQQIRNGKPRFRTIKRVASRGMKGVKNGVKKGGRMVIKGPRAAYNFMFNNHHHQHPPNMDPSNMDPSYMDTMMNQHGPPMDLGMDDTLNFEPFFDPTSSSPSMGDF